MNMLRFGAGSAAASHGSLWPPAAFGLRQSILPARKQAFQRKQRQEHMEVDVSDHRSVRNSRMLSKVARPEQALLFAANGHKHHTPPELAEDGMKFFNVFCEVLTDFEVKLFL